MTQGLRLTDRETGSEMTLLGHADDGMLSVFGAYLGVVGLRFGIDTFCKFGRKVVYCTPR